MGEIINQKDEEEAIACLHALPDATKGLVAHHLRNSLMNFVALVELSGMTTREYEKFSEVINHVKDDLTRFGF